MESCSICLTAFTADITILKTPCGHRFCENCLQTWLAISQSCPNDRLPITSIKTCLTERMCKCDWIGTDLATHRELWCRLQPTTCGICKEKISKAEWDEHTDAHFKEESPWVPAPPEPTMRDYLFMLERDEKSWPRSLEFTFEEPSTFRPWLQKNDDQHISLHETEGFQKVDVEFSGMVRHYWLLPSSTVAKLKEALSHITGISRYRLQLRHRRDVLDDTTLISALPGWTLALWDTIFW